jgi:hypothetical protein
MQDAYPNTIDGHISFLEEVRDEVHNAAEAKRHMLEHGYSNDTIKQMISGIKWSEAHDRVLQLSNLPLTAIELVVQVVKRKLSIGTIEQVDELIIPAVLTLRNKNTEYTELLQACGLSPDPNPNSRHCFDLALQLLQLRANWSRPGKTEDYEAGATVMLTAAVGWDGGEHVLQLQSRRRDSNEREPWICHKDLKFLLTQLGGLTANRYSKINETQQTAECRSFPCKKPDPPFNELTTLRAVNLALKKHWLESREEDFWEPGMKTGSGKTEVVRASDLGMEEAYQLTINPPDSPKFGTSHPSNTADSNRKSSIIDTTSDSPAIRDSGGATNEVGDALTEPSGTANKLVPPPLTDNNLPEDGTRFNEEAEIPPEYRCKVEDMPLTEVFMKDSKNWMIKQKSLTTEKGKREGARLPKLRHVKLGGAFVYLYDEMITLNNEIARKEHEKERRKGEK